MPSPPCRSGDFAVPRTVWSGALTAALALAAGGCSLGGGAPPEEPTPPPAQEEAAEPEPSADQGSSDTDEAAELLTRAEAHFEAGRFREAESLFVRYLESPDAGGDGRTDRALWGLAMVNLLPESPIRDRDRAMVALDRLAETHGETVRGAQARWVRSLLAELESIRSQVDAQERLLLQLTETVEQLKRIDLNRRPSRAPPDSVPGPAPDAPGGG